LKQAVLTIRQEQLEVIRQSHLQKFEDEMVGHLKKTQVEHWKVMGEEDGRKVIRLGIKQAGSHGFTRRGPVRFYIDLMFTFGSFFDTDPQYPWASTALLNPGNYDEAVIADRLFSAMTDYYVNVVDPEREHLKASVKDLTKNRVKDVLQPGINLEELILKTLRSVCPIRCAYSGDTVLRGLIKRGFELAKQYELETDKGKVLMATLTFAVGHGFYKDPLNGWIVRRLENKRWPDPSKRVDDLSSKSMLYLEHILVARSQA
jgi:hypothetical protein